MITKTQSFINTNIYLVYMKTLHVQITPELHKKFKTLCSKKGKFMREVLRMLINEWLERNESV